MIEGRFRAGDYISPQSLISEALHASHVLDMIYALGSQHAALVVALRMGYGWTKAGDLSLVKLSRAMDMPQAEVSKLLNDMRQVIARAA